MPGPLSAFWILPTGRYPKGAASGKDGRLKPGHTIENGNKAGDTNRRHEGGEEGTFWLSQNFMPRLKKCYV